MPNPRELKKINLTNKRESFLEFFGNYPKFPFWLIKNNAICP